MEEVPLPEGINYGIDVRPLNQAFVNVTNSYKFFFFLAILDWLDFRFRSFADLEIPFEWLAERMAVNAWYPAVYYGLSLGSQDMLSPALRKLRDRLTVDGSRFTIPPSTALGAPQARAAKAEFFNVASRFVPFRFIRPFFRDQLAGLPDGRVNPRIFHLAKSAGDHVPYRLIGTHTKPGGIELTSPWAAYLATYRPILTDWARWHLSRYLARRNPFATQIPAKLLPPDKRSPSNARHAVSEWLVERERRKSPVRCLYSGKVIPSDDFHLDHFLPRAFVAHDRIWNLAPVIPNVNLSKGMSVPSTSYLHSLVESHTSLLSFLRMTSSGSDGFEALVREYENDLSLDLAAPVSPTRQLRDRYEAVVLPLMRSAELYGFRTEWRYGAAG